MTTLNNGQRVTSIAALNAAIDAADGAAANSGAYEIDLGGNIALTSALEAINLKSGVSLDIEGDGFTLDGKNESTGATYNQRGLFVYTGTVTIESLTIADTKAIGGAGGIDAGGGAGLGGGLFVAGAGNVDQNGDPVTGGDVTLSNVSFTGDSATGGAGGAGSNAGGAGGGGGMAGAGSAYSSSGGGGGGAGVAGTPNEAGASGSEGGFGGGGGGGISAGAGGFGGGGGGVFYGVGGAGGFGGGGGGGFDEYATGATDDDGDPIYAVGPGGGAGGFGAGAGGNGTYSGGGGGLGAGGDIFVQAGASLTITGGTLGQGAVTGGSGTNTGQAYGAGLFLQGDQSVTFGVGQTASQTTTISGDITDQAGSDTGNLYNDPGAGSVIIAGAGTVVLGGTDTYKGGTTIAGGTLELQSAAAAGTGAITFAGTSTTLKIDGATVPTNTLKTLAIGDRIILAGLAYDASATTVLSNGNTTLTVTTAAGRRTLTLAGESGQFAASNLNGATLLTDVATSTITGTVAGQTTTSEAPIKPFSGVTLVDANSTAFHTLTLTLSTGGAGGGTLSGTGLSGSGPVYTLTGTALAVTAALKALTFTPTAGSPNTVSTTTFTLSDTSSASPTQAVDTTTTVADQDPAVAPTITGTVAGQITTVEASIRPFAGATIKDRNANGMDTLTITLTGAGGSLSGAGLGGSGDSYTLTGTADVITRELQALAFIPMAGSPGTVSFTGFSLSDKSTAFATAAVDPVTMMLDVDPAAGQTGPVLYADALGPHVLSYANGSDSVHGTLVFTDSNLTDRHSVGQSAPTFSWSGGTLTSTEQAELAGLSTLAVTDSDSTGSGTGSIGFTYDLPNIEQDFLQAGQTLSATYSITVTDQNGVSATRPVTFTVDGTLNAAVSALYQPQTAIAVTTTGSGAPIPAQYQYTSTLVPFSDETPAFATAAIPDGRNDDGSVKVDLPYVLNIGGTSYSSLYINNNGNITFGQAFSTFAPAPFPIANNVMIAPFWTDIDTRGGTSSTFGDPKGGALPGDNVYDRIDPTTGVLTITWDNVGVYSGNDGASQLYPEGDTFQAQIVPRGNGDFDVIFRYAAINLLAGSASANIPAQVGFDYGDGIHYYAIPGSRTTTIAHLPTMSNVGMPGVFVFDFRGSAEYTQPNLVAQTAPLTVTEMANTTGRAAADTASGTLGFTELTQVAQTAPDAVSVSQTGPGLIWSGGVLSAARQAEIAIEGTLTLTTTLKANSSGSLALGYTAPDQLFDFLAAGETLTETYQATITNSEGFSSTQPIVIKVTGSNDAPVLAADAAGPHATTDVAHALAGTASLGFTDPDLSDTHSVSVAAPTFTWSGGTLDTTQLTALAAACTILPTLTDSTGSGSGSVALALSATDAAFAFLQAGQTLTVSAAATVQDNHGLSTTQSVSFVVPYQAPPVVTASATANIVEATSAAGAAETFTGTATDTVDGTDPVTYTEQLTGGATQVVHSGDTFALGVHTIVAAATDAAGNAGAATFTFDVVDTTPPAVTASATAPTVEATSAAGAVETFTGSASDLVDGSGDAVLYTEELAGGVTRVVHSGDTFAIGSHTIVASATDAAGNVGAAQPFTVDVVDTTPPTVTASATAPIVQATSAAGAVETFTGSATDLVDGTSDPIVYTEELAGGATQVVYSGDTFAIGSHTIVASATDAAGNAGTATAFTFDVVAPAVPTLADVTVSVGATGASGTAVTLAGTVSDPDSTVALYDGTATAANLIGIASVSATGVWQLAATLPAGTYDGILAIATDPVGQTANLAAAVSLGLGIAGQPFVAVAYSHDDDGKLTGATYYTADGSSYGTRSYAADGSSTATVPVVTGEAYTSKTLTYAADGTRTGATYAGFTGRPYTTISESFAGGIVASITYLAAGGSLYETRSYAADGSSTATFPAAAGEAYTSKTLTYAADGTRTAATFKGFTGRPYTTMSELRRRHGREHHLSRRWRQPLRDPVLCRRRQQHGNLPHGGWRGGLHVQDADLYGGRHADEHHLRRLCRATL